MTLRTSRWIAVLAVPLAAGLALAFAAPKSPKDAALVATVKRGDFRITITTSGELQAPEFTAIRAPDAEGGETYQTRITRLVPEGTVVKSGDFVAELDRTAVAQRLQATSDALAKAQEQVTQAKLDTAISLTGARAQLTELTEALEDKRLAKDQAAYEAPTIKRQVELDLAKAVRGLEEMKAGFATKEQQAAAKVLAATAEVDRQQTKIAALNHLMEQFTVRAPAAGMVVYKRDDNNGETRSGSVVGNQYNQTIAILPNFQRMESVTYVSEVDIAKVAIGQPVRVGLDRDPWKRLTGKVASVANIGQQRKSDAKVFAVGIQIILDRPDSTIRPGMTTSNMIEVDSIPDALSLPIDAVMNAGDTIYVYKREGAGVVRQQIELGPAGENDIVVRRGLAAGDEILITEPSNGHALPLKRL